MAATPITAVPVTTRDYRLESALVAATGGPLGMEATVITVTAAGIIQGMVTGGVDIAATVMGGVGTLVMAEAILAHIVEVLMPPAVDSRDTAEEVPSLVVVVVGAEAAGIVRELVQELGSWSKNSAFKAKTIPGPGAWAFYVRSENPAFATSGDVFANDRRFQLTDVTTPHQWRSGLYTLRSSESNGASRSFVSAFTAPEFSRQRINPTSLGAGCPFTMSWHR